MICVDIEATEGSEMGTGQRRGTRPATSGPRAGVLVNELARPALFLKPALCRDAERRDPIAGENLFTQSLRSLFAFARRSGM